MKNAHYLENGLRQRLGYNRAFIGNGTWGIKWSRDTKHHVTLTGRGRDTNMLGPIILNMTGDMTSCDPKPLGHPATFG